LILENINLQIRQQNILVYHIPRQVTRCIGQSVVTVACK